MKWILTVFVVAVLLIGAGVVLTDGDGGGDAISADSEAHQEHWKAFLAHPEWDRMKVIPFYRDLLGLHIVPAFENGPGVAFMETDDGTMFHLSEPSDARPPAHIAFEVEDFDAVHGRLVELGYEIQGPEKRGDGRPAMKISDPDGNCVEFTTGPGPISIADRVVDEWGRTSIPG